ncbi:CTP synthase C-terminal region-related (seleno)protein [Yinghuangia sp. YIM S09857]|uniref:CTP synthase C-terminal region-related (seleno)protein n=1 Tax=Yinghuangia sp. YIM S09857 TaxID=3436929 RepID=UPI003F53C99A
MKRILNVAVIGDHDASSPTHAATDAALLHSAAALGIGLKVRWFGTGSLESDVSEIAWADVLWCAPGSPYRSLAGAVAALRYGREKGVPTLGTCGGCQHMVLEYARNVLGYEDAGHAEYDPYASTLFVSELTCSLVGRTMPVALTPGSRVAAVYGTTGTEERYYCNFGIDPARQTTLHEGGFAITGVDGDGEPRVLELPDHPYYIATLFVPQARSRPDAPHPLVTYLLRAAL